MSSTNKRSILLVVWLAMLGGLYAVITHLNGASSSAAAPPAPLHVKIKPTLSQQWPQIVAHAAGPPRGAPDAAYTLVEFGDFQCPQCGKMRPLIEQLVAQSHGQANLLFCERPFPNIHHWALVSGQASLAAAAQGKFWPMYDQLYAHQDDLEPGYYNDYASAIGLNVAAFQTAMNSKQYAPTETADASFADSLGIQVTPTLLLRNNKTGAITVYIGSTDTAPGAAVGYQGIMQLAAAPPWEKKTTAAGAH